MLSGPLRAFDVRSREASGVIDLRDDAVRKAQGIDRAELACGWLTFQLAG